MRRALPLFLSLALSLVLSSCGEPSTAQGEIGEILAASRAFDQEVKEAGGVIVSVSGSEVRVAPSMESFDVAPGTALHYLLVKGLIYVDATLGDRVAFIEGTETNLRELGVDPEQAVEDAAMLTLLMLLPRQASSWGAEADDLVRISPNSHRLTVPATAIKGADEAGLTGKVQLFFVRDNAGRLTQWGVFEKAGQAVAVEKFSKVEVTSPPADTLISVPGR